MKSRFFPNALVLSASLSFGLGALAIDPALIPKAPPPPDAPTWQKPFKMADYKGKPYTDDVFKKSPQVIPGCVQPAYYDFGGEGVAYHDTTPKNLGSGTLNTGKDYLSQFRKDEAVDISYTKHAFDESEYDLYKPVEHQLYVGWTEPGEWVNMTVDIKKAGTYAVDLLYTSRLNSSIGLDINGSPVSGLIKIPSTANDKGPQDWHQWHNWNYLKDMADVKLPKGINVLTLRTMDNGQMNYAFLVFYPKPAGTTPAAAAPAKTTSVAPPVPTLYTAADSKPNQG